jgi:DNA-binding transcriptional MerR regulator
MEEGSKLYYTVGDVSKILGENASLVRFWSDKFSSFIKPVRNKKGNRLFSPDDVETFKKLHMYIKERGMTLEGAAKVMKNNTQGDNRADVALRLKGIRDMLQQIHDNI